MFETTNGVLVNFWMKLVNFLPDLFGGLLIILVGYIVSAILKKILLAILTFFRIDAILNKTKLLSLKEVRLWEEILA